MIMITLIFFSEPHIRAGELEAHNENKQTSINDPKSAIMAQGGKYFVVLLNISIIIKDITYMWSRPLSSLRKKLFLRISSF